MSLKYNPSYEYNRTIRFNLEGEIEKIKPDISLIESEDKIKQLGDFLDGFETFLGSFEDVFFLKSGIDENEELKINRGLQISSRITRDFLKIVIMN